MTDSTGHQPGVSSEEPEPTGPVIRDKRRLDPETGAVRGAGAGAAKLGETPPGSPQGDAPQQPGGSAEGDSPTPESADSGGGQSTPAATTEQGPDSSLADDLKRDLQRLNAEYVNYKRRVDRDRELHKDLAVSGVVEALLPVLDDIDLARQHGDLEEGPFAAIAEKLESTLGRFGVVRYGAPGEPFDPNVHEALMHSEAELDPGTEVTTIVQVLQAGYKMGDRVIRAARVAVADPQQ